MSIVITPQKLLFSRPSENFIHWGGGGGGWILNEWPNTNNKLNIKRHLLDKVVYKVQFVRPTEVGY